jgi:hypothetical protein
MSICKYQMAARMRQMIWSKPDLPRPQPGRDQGAGENLEKTWRLTAVPSLPVGDMVVKQAVFTARR